MINMLIAGDFCVRGQAGELLDDKRVEKISTTVSGITEKYDISMVNVETVFSENAEPIVKSGPNIKSPMKALELLDKMNFTVGACANNHMGDYGDLGVMDTLAAVKSAGMLTVGAGENKKAAEEILYVEKNGEKVAIINSAEHEFGIAKKDRPGVAGMDVYNTAKFVKESKENADYALVYIHGGHEECPLPRKGLVKFCRHLAENGADAVIVCHSHCPVGYEIYEDVPIVYGTGNFYMTANAPEGMWEYGYLVDLTLKKGEKAELEILPYIQKFDGSSFKLMENNEKEDFLKYINRLSELIFDEAVYEKIMLAWCDIYMEITAGWAEIKNKSPENGAVMYVRNTYTCESHSELHRKYYEAYCDKKLDGLDKYKDMIKALQNYELV